MQGHVQNNFQQLGLLWMKYLESIGIGVPSKGEAPVRCTIFSDGQSELVFCGHLWGVRDFLFRGIIDSERHDSGAKLAGAGDC